MRIKLPFVFAAEVVVGKKKNPATHYFVDTAVADMPEVTERDAPVAVTWYSSNGANLAQHARLHDGAFYVPAAKLQRDASSFTPEILAGPSRFDTDDKKWSVANMLELPLGKPEWHAMTRLLGPKAEVPPQPHEIKQTESSEEASRRSRAEEVARSLISVEGIVYRRVEEPVFSVSLNTEAHAPTVTLDVAFGRRRLGEYLELDDGVMVTNPMTTKFFPLSSHDEAEEVAASYGVPVIRKFVGEPDVVITDAFSFDREFEAAVRTVEFAVEGLRAGIHRFDRPTIETWLEIREQFDRWKLEGGQDIVENLATDDVPRLAEMVSGLEPGIADAIEAGLGDWNEGTISVNFSGGPHP